MISRLLRLWFEVQHGVRLSCKARVHLADNSGAGWVTYSQKREVSDSQRDLQALCTLYAPKMLFNAQRCPEGMALMDDMLVLVEGAKKSGLDDPQRLSSHFLRGMHLLDGPPDGTSMEIRAELFRSQADIPIIQTHFGPSVGPPEAVASIRVLWGWAARQAGEQGLGRLWLALGLVPYYHQQHSEEHGRVWDFHGWMAWSSYVVHMLASQDALEQVGKAGEESEL